MTCKRLGLGLLATATLAALAGCHSYHIESTVENRTGAAVTLIEVDYPYGSFGTNTIAAGADFHYRLQVEGGGPIKIQFTEPNGHTTTATGPTLAVGQEGTLQIILLPQAKVEFEPQLRPRS